MFRPSLKNVREIVHVKLEIMDDCLQLGGVNSFTGSLLPPLGDRNKILSSSQNPLKGIPSLYIKRNLLPSKTVSKPLRSMRGMSKLRDFFSNSSFTFISLFAPWSVFVCRRLKSGQNLGKRTAFDWQTKNRNQMQRCHTIPIQRRMRGNPDPQEAAELSWPGALAFWWDAVIVSSWELSHSPRRQTPLTSHVIGLLNNDATHVETKNWTHLEPGEVAYK